CTEPRPLRSRELLEQMGLPVTTHRRSVSASKTGRETPRKTPNKASCITTSTLLVPSIGFSYPKATPPASSKRRLAFQNELDKDSLRQKLERITSRLKELKVKGWQANAENRLRRLTISDLLSLLRFLLPTTGVKLPKHLNRDSYVVPLMEALQLLGYPKKVNPSWLRMPDGHVLEILDFLLDFVDNREEGSLCVFPIVEEQQAFEQVATAFGLDSEQLEQRRQELLAKGLATQTHLLDLQQRLENLKLEIQNFNLDAQLNALKAEEQCLETDLINCSQEIVLVNSKIEVHEKKITEIVSKNQTLQQKLTKLQNQVEHQIYTPQAYTRLLDLREARSHELKIHLLRIQEFSERLKLAHLKLKRCRKELVETIEAFNVQIRDFEFSLIFKNHQEISLQLPLNPTLQDIRERVKRLQLRKSLLESSAVK
ncbi:hypothetical protein KR074_004196, partial [Drosophila pseudoananassae]